MEADAGDVGPAPPGTFCKEMCDDRWSTVEAICRTRSFDKAGCGRAGHSLRVHRDDIGILERDRRLVVISYIPFHTLDGDLAPPPQKPPDESGGFLSVHYAQRWLATALDSKFSTNLARSPY